MSNRDLRQKLIDAVAAAVIGATDELTALDQAIGDGDHGLNMKRGFEAVLAERDAIAALDWGEALRKLGMILVMKVGGASGPLYGTLFMELGKAWPAEPSVDALAESFQAAIDAVKRRGKADIGQKTMLDVLAPVQARLAAGEVALGEPALDLAEATKPMQASKGRASFLGPRSVGHVDPGARSSALIVAAVCDTLGAQP